MKTVRFGFLATSSSLLLCLIDTSGVLWLTGLLLVFGLSVRIHARACGDGWGAFGRRIAGLFVTSTATLLLFIRLGFLEAWIEQLGNSPAPPPALEGGVALPSALLAVVGGTLLSPIGGALLGYLGGRLSRRFA